MTKFYDSGFETTNKTYHELNVNASRVHAYMKEHCNKPSGWMETGIGLFVDKSNLLMMDCNATSTHVYKRKSIDEEWYTEHDELGIAVIHTVSGLQDFLIDYYIGFFNNN